jgi:hypothetical protein
MSRTILDESLDLFATPRPMRVYLELPDGSFVPAITNKVDVCNDIAAMRYVMHIEAVVDVPPRREGPPPGFRDRVRAGIERARSGLPEKIEVMSMEEIARDKARRQMEAEERQKREETNKRFAALDLED